MKIQKLIIKNIGIIEDTTIEFNKPLLLFYGEIRQGKTTILNAVRWACGGSFPADIIRHEQKEASVELAFDGGMIRREWYRAKDGSTKARDVVFVQNGRPVKRPASELERFLNPFLLNQDYLRNMGETERKKFFTEMFAVDTTEIDTKLFNSQRQAENLRAEIKGYGEIDLKPVETVDVTAIKVELEKQRKAHADEVEKVRQLNAAATERSSNRRVVESEIQSAKDAIAEAEKILAGHKATLTRKLAHLETMPPLPVAATPAAPDLSLLETKIQEANAVNVRAEQYERNKKRAEEKAAKEKELSAHEANHRTWRAERVAKLKDVSATCGVKGLVFNEDGTFSYEGTDAGMLSTSQIMRLSSELSALYPEGFSIELLDRGESLGRAIFDYVELAKREQKTILATIVGQKPAETPPEVGVFVVKDGIVMEETK